MKFKVGDLLVKPNTELPVRKVVGVHDDFYEVVAINYSQGIEGPLFTLDGEYVHLNYTLFELCRTPLWKALS